MNTWEYTTLAAEKIGITSDRGIARWLGIHQAPAQYLLPLAER